jgi:hypothetical protein
MSSLVHTEAKGDFAQSNDRTVVSTKAFDTEFYSYRTALNATFQTVGTFSIVAGATAATCPLGRVLHLTGKKLYPDVNPMNTFVSGSPLTAKKFLVSVYDPISFLTGFIDPTSNTFAGFDQGLPNFFNTGRDGSGVEWSGGGRGVDIYAVDSGNLSESTLGDGVTVPAKNASCGQITPVTTAVTISTTACTATSRILLTQVGGTATTMVAAAGAGSFTITLTANVGTVVVNWLIIN